MVTLCLNITIDEFIASTDSIIEIYLNNVFIGSLNSNFRNFKYSVTLASDEHHLVIKRKYMRPESLKKSGFIQRVLSSAVSLVLMASSIIEPFDCPYECEEILKISIDGDSPKINIACIQNEDDQCPKFFVDSQSISLQSKKTMFISREELKDIYTERRRLICAFFSLFTIMIAVILFFSFVENNLTTVAFLLVVFSLVLFCTIYSLTNLKKEYLTKAKLSK